MVCTLTVTDPKRSNLVEDFNSGVTSGGCNLHLLLVNRVGTDLNLGDYNLIK